MFILDASIDVAADEYGWPSPNFAGESNMDRSESCWSTSVAREAGRCTCFWILVASAFLECLSMRNTPWTLSPYTRYLALVFVKKRRFLYTISKSGITLML